MRDLALLIRDRLDVLTEEYLRRMHEIEHSAERVVPMSLREDDATHAAVQEDEWLTLLQRSLGFDEVDDSMARAIAREELLLVAVGLETGDVADLNQFTRERTSRRMERGFTCEDVMAMRSALEETLWPHVVTVDQAKFLSRVFSQEREIVAQGAIEALRQLQQMLLERRSERMQASLGISQELAAVPRLGELFQRVVALIVERLGYYYVQIFRYEPALDALALVAGYGEVGRRMLAEGYSLPMRGSEVGTAATTGQSVLVRDTSQQPDWMPHPYLPETRGELAVPITLRYRVLGIIDVQSDVAGALDDEDRLLLEAIRGPVALAVESTVLRQEMEDNVRELALAQRAASKDGWATFRQSGRLPAG